MNTRFEYLYRDGGNWQNRGSVVFRGEPSPGFDTRLRKACDAWDLFIADQVRLPELFFTDYPVNEDDHCYHEFSSLTAVEEEADDVHSRSISEFVDEFERAGNAWRVFVRCAER